MWSSFMFITLLAIFLPVLGIPTASEELGVKTSPDGYEYLDVPMIPHNFTLADGTTVTVNVNHGSSDYTKRQSLNKRPGPCVLREQSPDHDFCGNAPEWVDKTSNASPSQADCNILQMYMSRNVLANPPYWICNYAMFRDNINVPIIDYGTCRFGVYKWFR